MFHWYSTFYAPGYSTHWLYLEAREVDHESEVAESYSGYSVIVIDG